MVRGGWVEVEGEGGGWREGGWVEGGGWRGGGWRVEGGGRRRREEGEGSEGKGEDEGVSKIPWRPPALLSFSSPPWRENLYLSSLPCPS
jgi:hypothetical protein